MQLAQIKETPDWRLLTEKEKKFLITYFSNGYDIGAASGSVWSSPTEQAARDYGFKAIRRPNVATIVRMYFGGRPPSKEQIWDCINEGISPKNINWASRYSYVKLACDLKGMTRAAEAAPEEEAGTTSPVLRELLEKAQAKEE